MFYWIIFILGLTVTLAAQIFKLRQARGLWKTRLSDFAAKFVALGVRNAELAGRMADLETRIGDYFFFYELARKLAPLSDRQSLVDMFFTEIKTLGEVERVAPEAAQAQGALIVSLGDRDGRLCLKTASSRVIEYMPHLASLLGLCSERIDLYERLQQLSIFDSLTGVYNRRYFMERLSEEFSRAQRFNLDLSFLMIDIDNFKKINDTYGHLVGDAVLREIARLIWENLREIDFVARYGGEEFSVVLLDTDKTAAIMVAERICSRISRERLKAFDETLAVTVSLGVAGFPANTRYLDVLIETADKALYKAKAAGKNRACYF